MLQTGSKPQKKWARNWDNFDGNIHSRGHLIGKQFGGTGRDARNIMHTFSYVDGALMQPFEDAIREAVKGGEVVYFWVQPTYKGDGSLVDTIKFRARGSNGFRLEMIMDNANQRLVHGEITR